ncbi:MAG: acetyl-CoA carboxylase biotin carboxyl carrier protein subunit [Thermodesulfobacteriota bacterium]
MRFRVKIDNQIFPIEACAADEHGYCRMAVNGMGTDAAVKAIAAGHLHLEANGEATNVFVARSGSGLWVWVDGRARLVFDADTEQRRRGTVRREGPREVTPPTPATVVRVPAIVGDHVEKGQALVVVSAMKMELTLTAPYSGTVSAVHTEVGAKVSPGEILVEIEADPEGETHG